MNQPGDRGTAHHQMSMCGKRDGFTLGDFEQDARVVGMKRGRAGRIVDEVMGAVASRVDFAHEAGVSEEHTRKIQRALHLDLPTR